jgi:hypothetical protein
MNAGDGKLLVLFQRTKFCEFAAKMVEKKFSGMVLLESLRTYSEGKKIMRGRPENSPAILLWSGGDFHHFSNILNIPFSIKNVFDNHDDNAPGASLPEFDSHNSFSRNEGVIIRVCRQLGSRPVFSPFDEAKGNGTLHLSFDLDFLEGFPCLPWMSCGSNSEQQLREYAVDLAKSNQLRRLDIGGYHEMGNPTESAMGEVFEKYYDALIGGLVPLMRH